MAADPAAPRDGPAHGRVLLDRSGRARAPVPAETLPLSEEQEGEDDRLETPAVAPAPVLLVTFGMITFLLVFLFSLAGVYRAKLGDWTAPVVRRFPEPRLETNIDPRTLPASEPGPAEPRPPVVPHDDPERIRAAMAAVLARGPSAYGPLAAPAPAPPPGSAQTAAAGSGAP